MAVNIGPRIGIEGEAEYRKQLQGIIQSTRTLKSEMAAMSSAFSREGASLSQNQAYRDRLCAAIEQQKQKLSQLRQMEEKAAQKTGEGSAQTMKWRQAVADAEAELNRLNSTLRETPTQLELAGQKMQGLGESVSSIGQGISGIGAKMTAAVTVPLAGLAASAVKGFAGVDTTMRLVNETMGNSETEAAALQSAMEEAAAASTFGMEDAAKAALNFARGGWDAEQAAAALTPAMNLAAGQEGNLDTVTAGLMATMNGFHASADEAGRYADIFAAACNNSALDVDSLSSSMSIAAPIFQTSGSSIEDAALAMGVMADGGHDANKAATALKTGIARLASNDSAIAELEKLGLTAFNTSGDMKGMAELQGELHDAFARLTSEEKEAAAAALFGQNQMAPWLSLIDAAPEKVRGLAASLAESKGTAEGMAEALMSGVGGSIEKLKSSLDVVKYQIGGIVGEALQPLVERVTAAVDAFRALDPAAKGMAVRLAAAAAAAGPATAAFGKLVSGTGGLISAIGKGLPLLGGFGSTMGIMVAGIAGAVTAVGALTGAFDTFFPGLSDRLGEIPGMVSSFISTSFPKMLEAGRQAVGKVAEGVAQGIPLVAKSLMPMLEDISGAIRDGASFLVDAGLSLLEAVARGFSEALPSFISSLPGIVSNIASIISDNAPKLLASGARIIGTLATGILEAIPTLVASIPKIVKAIFDVFLAQNWVDIGTGILTGISSGLSSVAGTLGEIGQNAIASFKSINWAEAGRTAVTAIGNALSALAGGIPEALRSIGEAAKALFGSIDWAGAGRAAMDFLINGISGLASGLWSALRSVGEGAWNAFKSIDWIALGKAVLTFIGSGIGAAASTLGKILSGAGKAAKEKLASIDWKGAGEKAASLVSSGLKKANEIGTRLKEAGDAAREKLLSIDWAGIGKRIIESVGRAIKDGASAFASSVKSLFTNAFSGGGTDFGAAESGKRAAESYAKGVEEGGAAVQAATEGTAAGPWQETSAPRKAGEKGTESAESYKAGVSGSLAGYTADTSNVLDRTALTSEFSEAGKQSGEALKANMDSALGSGKLREEMRGKGAEGGQGLASGLQEGADGHALDTSKLLDAGKLESEMRAAGQKGMSALASAMESGAKSATSAASAAAKSLSSAFAAGFTQAAKDAQAGMSAVKAAVSSAMGEASQAASSGMSAMASAVASGGQAVSSAAGSAAGGVRSAFAAVDLYGTGSSMMQGLINGINSRAADVQAAAASLASSAAAAANSALKVSSPSKVMEETGGYVAEGLAAGIRQEGWLAAEASASMAEGVLDAAKGTLEIASPSRRFEQEVGRNVALGLGDGIRNNAAYAEKSSQEIGEAILSDAEQRLENHKTYNEMSLEAEAAYWDAIREQVDAGTQARVDADRKYLGARAAADQAAAAAAEQASADRIEALHREGEAMTAAVSQMDTSVRKQAARLKKYFSDDQSAMLQAATTWSENRKVYRGEDLKREAAYWDSVRKLFKAGTQERVDADKRYYEAKAAAREADRSAAEKAAATEEAARKKAMDRLATSVKGMGKSAAQASRELLKAAGRADSEAVSAAQTWLSNREAVRGKDLKYELAYWKNILGSAKRNSQAYIDAYKEYSAVRDALEEESAAKAEERDKRRQEAAVNNASKAVPKMAAQAKALQKAFRGHYDELISGAEKWLQNERVYRDISAKQEAAYWDRIRKLYKKGTDERIEADRKYYDAKAAAREEDAKKEEAAQKKQADKWAKSMKSLLQSITGTEKAAAAGKNDKGSNTIYNAAKEQLKAFRNSRDVTLKEEETFWKKVAKLTKAGSTAQTKALQNAAKARQKLQKQAAALEKQYRKEAGKTAKQLKADVKAVNAQLKADIADAKAQLAEGLAKVNDALAKDIESANKSFEDSLSARASSIAGAFGIFDEAKLDASAGGDALLEAMRQQDKAVQNFSSAMEHLKARLEGIGSFDWGLYTEIAGQGPKSLRDVEALDSLTDEQLEAYVRYYRSKERAAAEEAERELAREEAERDAQVAALKEAAEAERKALKDESSATIAQLRADAQAERDALAKEAAATVAKLGKEYASGMAALGTEAKAKAVNIGKQVVNGIKSGIKNTQSTLYDSLQSLASQMEKKLRKSLGIQSPSRVMRDEVGKYIPLGIAAGVEKYAGTARDAVAELAEREYSVPLPHLHGGANGSAGSSYTTSYGGISVNVYEASDAKATADMVMRRLQAGIQVQRRAG